MEHGTSLVVHTPKAGDMGSIHDRELRSCLPHGMAKEKKKKLLEQKSIACILLLIFLPSFYVLQFFQV